MPEINIGQLSEAINDKMDRDAHNVESPSAVVVESYVNGTSWYRVWSDGWCEQGNSKETSSASWKTVTLLKPYTNTNYSVTATCNGNVNGTSTWTTVVDGQAYTTTQIQVKGTNADASWLICWRAAGYIS